MSVVQRTLADLLAPVDHDTAEDVAVALYLVDEGVVQLDRDLLASIADRGQLCPVILNGEGENDRYTVIDGRRRVRALRELGVTAVQARVYRVDTLVADALATTANTVRRPNPENELEAIESLLAAGFDEAQIARATGMRLQTIRKRRRLQGIPVAIRDGLRSGLLSVSVAERIAGMSGRDQRRMVRHLAATGRVTASDVARVLEARRADAIATLPVALFADQERAPVTMRLYGALREVAARAALDGIDAETFTATAARAWQGDDEAGAVPMMEAPRTAGKGEGS